MFSNFSTLTLSTWVVQSSPWKLYSKSYFFLPTGSLRFSLLKKKKKDTYIYKLILCLLFHYYWIVGKYCRAVSLINVTSSNWLLLLSRKHVFYNKPVRIGYIPGSNFSRVFFFKKNHFRIWNCTRRLIALLGGYLNTVISSQGCIAHHNFSFSLSWSTGVEVRNASLCRFRVCGISSTTLSSRLKLVNEVYHCPYCTVQTLKEEIDFIYLYNHTTKMY